MTERGSGKKLTKAQREEEDRIAAEWDRIHREQLERRGLGRTFWPRRSKGEAVVTPERWRIWPLSFAIAPWRENARLRRWIASIGDTHFESLRKWNDSRLALEQIIRERLPAVSDVYADLGRLIAEQTRQQTKLVEIERRAALLKMKPKKATARQ
jgi:hypothetical protein